MGKATLIFVMALSVLGGMYAMNDQNANLETSSKISQDQRTILARNAALAGLDQAEQLMAETFKSYGNITGTYDGVTYRTKATKRGKNGAVVTSKGTITGPDGEAIEFHVRAEYERQTWSRIADDPPAFMSYLLMADGNLELQGSPKGKAYDPPDGSSSPPNVDVHTNRFIDVTGNSSDFEGFGTYTLGALPDENRVKRAFEPNDNPTGSDHVYQAPRVDLPAVDPAVIAAALVTDSVTVGNVNINGTAALPAGMAASTRDDPYVWHIQGNLVFSGNTEIPGYVMFLVDNNVSFNGDVTTPQASHDGRDESTVAYYAGGISNISGSVEIWGQIFSAQTNIDATGSPKLYGNLITHGSIILAGSADFFYRRASPALTTHWQGGNNDRLVRIAYSEWDVVDYSGGNAEGDVGAEGGS